VRPMEAYPFQVGGLSHSSKASVLLRGKDSVLKPLQEDHRGDQEIEFYHRVPETALGSYVPRLIGIVKIKDKRYLELEDLLLGFSCPCVLDVKVGRSTWDKFASAAKIEKERNKYKWQEEVGFRIVGMIKRDALDTEPVRVGKSFGRSLHPSQICSVLRDFFKHDTEGYAQELILNTLQGLSRTVESESKYSLTACSLLIAYETQEGRPPKAKAALIDFSHAFMEEKKTKDENFLFGIQSLITCISQAFQSSKLKSESKSELKSS